MELQSSRCGFSLAEDGQTDVSDKSRVCCWRETWKDTGRCVWHARTDDRTGSDFSAAALDPGDSLRGASIVDV